MRCADIHMTTRILEECGGGGFRFRTFEGENLFGISIRVLVSWVCPLPVNSLLQPNFHCILLGACVSVFPKSHSFFPSSDQPSPLVLKHSSTLSLSIVGTLSCYPHHKASSEPIVGTHTCYPHHKASSEQTHT